MINLVGVLYEKAVQAQGADLVARAAANSGARNLVHLSAIGASSTPPSAYARSKAAGEAAVRGAFPEQRSCGRASSSDHMMISSIGLPPWLSCPCRCRSSAAACRASPSRVSKFMVTRAHGSNPAMSPNRPLPASSATKRAVRFSNLAGREFTASARSCRWC